MIDAGSSNPAEQEAMQKEAGLAALKEFGVTQENSDLLTKTQDEIERAVYPSDRGRRLYGAVSHFANRDQIVAHFADEARYFSKYFQPGNADSQKPSWLDAFYAKGAILFELKFGQRLSEFCNQILKQYPDLGKEGKEISIFGLSGSGKSTALEALSTASSDVIAMDSDTIRYNLLAKLIADVELSHGTNLDEVRNSLMHNTISGPLYFAVNHIAKELKSRGYTIVRSSTMASEGADLTVYVEHPTVKPDELLLTGRDNQDNEIIEPVAKELYEVTQRRVQGPDNYNWAHLHTELDFRQMIPVTVQVPEKIHVNFVKKIHSYLQDHPEVVRITNPYSENAQAIQQNFTNQLRQLIS